MKKIFTLSFLVAIFSLNLFANPVNEEKAQQIGQSFLNNSAITPSGTLRAKSAVSYELIYTAKTVKSNIANPTLRSTEVETALFYVFGAENNGYVIVSGDDCVIPILGYADNGTFDPANIPPNMQKWLEGYKTEINYAIENNISATEEVQSEWERLTTPLANTQLRSISTVSPLIQTKWNQSPYYNNLCPYDNTAQDRTVTGCVATAMAQVLNYWEYPKQGYGFHSYNHSRYGTLSANFGSTTYDWVNMPNQLVASSSTVQKNAVATLMYHCGVSVDMNYGVSSTGGSGAYVISAKSPITHCTEYALKTYFGYKDSLRGVQKANYTQANWINLLKLELEAGRPIVYAGFGDGGHCFVADGYDSNNYFHFNWGWGGSYDGYFSLTALNPGSGGIGGGSYSYNDGQQAVIGIEPADGSGPAAMNFKLAMYADLSTSQSRYWFGDPITVTAKVENNGSEVFMGEFIAAAFDKQGNFIDFISAQQSQTLQPNYYTTKTFTYSGGAPFIPGRYSVAVFYRTSANSNWTIVPNDYGIIFDEINLAEFEVYYSSNIETNSAFTIGGTGILQQTQSATVNVDILNKEATTFYGKFRVGLANLDGSFVQQIGVVDITTNGLGANYHYTNGVNFTGTITADPGTYSMSLAYQRAGETSWYYAGSSDFQNPVYVIVEAPPSQADMYETNNTQTQAYNLSVSFSGNNANVKTTGSNLHIGTDLDYYKIVLPTGYNYVITPRLHDEYNSGNGQNYTVDALFSVSLNNTNIWSQTYDDLITSNINVENGGTLYFKVAPYFSGSTGTYLLDMQITRNEVSSSGIDDVKVDNQILVYPNPTKDFVTVDLKGFIENVNKIVLCDMQGNQIYSENIAFKKTITLPLSNISSGMYLVQFYSDSGVLTKKLIVKK